MEDSAYLLELISGIFYFCASFPLLRLAARSGERHERTLGIAFLLIGISYFFYELPFALASEALFVPFSLIGRVFYDASVLALALFTKQVFHRDQIWADRLLWSALVLMVVGFGISALYGDWEGLAPLSNPGFWPEWVGQCIPPVWVGIVGLAQYAKARRRVRVGLSDTLVCNRFLLFGLFGVFQLFSLVTLIPMYIGYEITGTFTTSSDLVLGSLEILTIAAIWLAFFPPALYRRWLRAAALAEGAEEG